ncbi:hypothetical protein GQ43DRAFT_464310 [Delitschia confertaspora ATCC 74209]|uniref:Uncharacterized protein n=1 Tax=Delitschia confertaspora ATCC 74209 TaxID=1513339 RepID=A0A9P4MNZ2_9PLEO|nr:hypothetical protein GQ43DRAFT_464310 [Delitschia confertaspora ATCC 74209]
MSELDPRYIKYGYWINRSQGPIMGQTITTDSKTGSIIIALLAICTSLATSRLWHLLTFVYHQCRANGKPSNGLFRQQQALLRTLPTASSLIADSVKLAFSWKRTKNRKTSLQLLPQTVLALVFTLGSMAAGIFSSLIVRSSNLEVLVSSPFCGQYWVPASQRQSVLSQGYEGQVRSISERYVQECYRGRKTLPARCHNIFTRSFIQSSIETVPCPFSAGICTSPAVAFDSGLLDVNDAFGFNLEDHERLKYRKRTTCAMLSQKDRTRRATFRETEWPTHLFGRPPLPEEELILYYFGTRPDIPAWQNVTYGVSLSEANVSKTLSTSGITWFLGRKNEDGPAPFVPIPELQHEDADTTLLRVKLMATTFIAPSDDFMFPIHQKSPRIDISIAENRTFYIADVPQTIAGCTEQYELCARNGSKGEFCTGLLGLEQTQAKFENRELPSKVTESAISFLLQASMTFNAGMTRSLNVSALLSASGIIPAIPQDQWKTEFNYWVSSGWAQLQTVITDYAIGPKVRDPDTNFPFIYPPSTEADKKLCHMIKMRKSGGIVNINVFGLTFIFTFTVLVTLLEFGLLRFLIFLSKFRKGLGPRVDRWIQDGVFHLQRRAYEAESQDTWKDLDEEIPLPMDGSTLFLDLPIQTFRTSSPCPTCSQASSSKPVESIALSGALPPAQRYTSLSSNSASYPAVQESIPQQELAPEESTPEESTLEESTPKESTPEELAPEESAPEESAPEKSTPEKSAL